MKTTVFRMLSLVIAVSACSHTTVTHYTPRPPADGGEVEAVKIATRICRRIPAGQKIVIDGDLSDEAWSRAEKIAPFRSVGEPAGPSATPESYVMLLWNDEYLYVAASLQDQDVTAYFKGRDEQLWTDGDVFEFFFKPREDSHHYYEFHVNPNNATVDLMFPRKGAGGWARFSSFESGMKTGVRIDGTLNNWRDIDRGWTAEMAIPFKCIENIGRKAPRPGAVWRIAPCRYDYSAHLPEEYPRGVELSTTAVGIEKNFHETHNYDRLVFEK